jgi:hypothetical protein
VVIACQRRGNLGVVGQFGGEHGRVQRLVTAINERKDLIAEREGVANCRPECVIICCFMIR